MKNGKSKSESMMSMRLDSISEKHIDAICDKAGLSRSVALRRMLAYIDDSECPVGHLTGFVEYSRRVDSFMQSALSAALLPSKSSR